MGSFVEDAETEAERRRRIKFLSTHSDLGLLDLLDLPLGGRNGAGGLRGETGGIVKTLLSVKAGFHHYPSHLLLLLYSGKASLSPLSFLFPCAHRCCLQPREPRSVWRGVALQEGEGGREGGVCCCGGEGSVRGSVGGGVGGIGGDCGSVTKSSLQLSRCHTSFKVAPPPHFTSTPSTPPFPFHLTPLAQ